LHPGEINCEERDCDNKDFDDEKEWPAVGDPNGGKKYVLYVGVEGKKPSVPLVVKRFPGEANASEYC